MPVADVQATRHVLPGLPKCVFLKPGEQQLARGLHVQTHVRICMDGNSVLQNSVFAKQTWAGLVGTMPRTTEATVVA